MRARHASVVIWVRASRRGTDACTVRATGRRGDWVGGGCGHDWLASVSGYGFHSCAGQSEKHLVEARLFDGGARDIELVVPQRDEDVGSLVGVAQREAESELVGEMIGVTRVSSAASATAFAVSAPRPSGHGGSMCRFGLELTRCALGDLPTAIDDRDPPASASASSRYWVVNMMVDPSATRSRIVSHIWLRFRGSRPVVGSSRKISAVW